jgi:uncharacterized membrane protein HdeD (DUF308 family)
MIEAMTKYWWVPVVRGICGVTFGVSAFVYPIIGLNVLIVFFGAWALVDGILSVAGAIGERKTSSDWVFGLVGGLLGITVGILTFIAPAISALALVFYIAAWALVRGALEIVLAIKIRREVKGEWILVVSGIASMIFAVLLLWNPAGGALALLWLIASFAIVLGILGVMFGFHIRSLGRQLVPATV